MNKCCVCRTKTNEIFNINFKAVLICSKCANSIMLQQMHDLVYSSEQNKGCNDRRVK